MWYDTIEINLNYLRMRGQCDQVKPISDIPILAHFVLSY